MKNLIFTVVLFICLGAETASAQFSRPITIGAGAGAVYGLTDLKDLKVNFGWYGEGDYLLNPFLSVGLRAEKGEISGSRVQQSFKNSYYVGNINAKLRMGKFMDLPDNYSYFTLEASNFQRIVSNIYIGAGAGLMKNSITASYSAAYQNAVVELGGKMADDRSGIHFIIPLNVGVDIPFGRTLYGPKWAINVNYQHTLATNDNIDGVINQNIDHYGFMSVGVKYAFFNRN